MDALTSRAHNPEEQALQGEMRAILESSFEALPEIYRTVFLLREVGPRPAPPGALRARGLTTAELFPFHLSRCDRVVADVLARLQLPPPAQPHCDCPGGVCRAGLS